MGRPTDRFQARMRQIETLDFLAPPNYVMATLRGLFDFPHPRLEKVYTLYNLVATVATGNCVELGSYHGLGVITMALAAKVNHKQIGVYAVDDYQDKQGWSGEQYVSDDEDVFWHNVHKAEVTVPLLRESVAKGAKFYANTVPGKIDFLFWDLGLPTIASTLPTWIPNLAPNAIVAIHDTYDGRFGAKQWFEWHPEFATPTPPNGKWFPGGIQIGIRLTEYVDD